MVAVLGKRHAKKRLSNLLAEDISGLFTMFGGYDVAGGRRHALAGDTVIYAKQDGSLIYQLYTRTLPFGAETQLTTYTDRHTGVPTFLADGKRFICQQEEPTHSDEGVVGLPGDGWYTNIVLGSINTAPAAWTKLLTISTTTPTEGVLRPVPDAQASDPTAVRLAYNWIYSRDTAQVHLDAANGIITANTHPFGRCELRMGTLNADTPALSGITTLLPGPGWYEPQDWNGDTLYFSSERAQAGYTHYPYRIAQWKLDVTDPANTVEQVSMGGDAWEEFGTLSPDGNSIVHMGSRFTGWNMTMIPRTQLRARLWQRGVNGGLSRPISRIDLPASNLLFYEPRWRGAYLYTGLFSYSGPPPTTTITSTLLARARTNVDPLPITRASVSLAGARAVNNSWTAPANFHLRFTVVSGVSAGSISLRLRMSNATNYWNLTSNNTGALNLFETVAGTPTLRASAAAVISAGSVVDVIAWDKSIRAYVNGTYRWSWETATNFKTATAADINSLGTGGAISDLIVWQYPLGD